MRPERFLISLSAAVAIVGVLLGHSILKAGEYNTTINIGDKAPVWQNLPGTDGKQHSLKDLSNAKVVVVAFTCNSCPYAIDAEDRINDLAKRMKPKGVLVVAINVNKVEDDLMPAMKDRATKKGFKFDYLFDQTQEIAKQFGAKYTPEFFVLDQQRTVAYMGALDDSPDGSKITVRHVESAIEAILLDQTVKVTETVPIGCRIRFERERRRRR